MSENDQRDFADVFSETALLSTSIPGGFGVGSAYLDALVSTENGARIRQIHPATSGKTQQPKRDGLAIDNWPQERYRPRLPGKIGSLASILHYRKNRLRIAPVLATRIAEWCKQNEVRRLWAVLESPAMYRIAATLLKNHEIEMVATIWDPPESVARQFGLDRVSRDDAIEDFDSVLAGCCRLGVISEAMGDHYSRIHTGIETTVMRLVPQSRTSCKQTTRNTDEFVIAFAGSLYASDEFRMLLAALDDCNWTVRGRPVRVQIMGVKLHHQATGPACIEFLGYRSSEDVARVMSAADCGYVPYWFDPAYQSAVRLCFPSKLITCLATGTPILFHGPKESTPADFLQKYDAGIACHATESAGIISSLETLADSDRKKMAAEGKRAIAEEFNDLNFQQRFRYLITGKHHD